MKGKYYNTSNAKMKPKSFQSSRVLIKSLKVKYSQALCKLVDI